VGTFQVNDTLFIQDSADASKWGKYSITGGFSDQGTWGYFPVKYLESTGAVPSNNAAVLMLAEVGASGGGSSSISDATVTNLTGLLVGNGTDVDALPVIDDLHLPPRLQTAGPYITDFNTVNMSGWYRPNNAANGPPGATPYGMLFHDAWDTANGHSFQLFNAMNDNTLWWRACITYAWQAWKKISPIDDSNLPARIASFEGDGATDYNTLTQSGWYHPSASAANAPGVGDWHLFVMRHTADYIKQIAYDYYSDAICQRVKPNPGSAFSAWTLVFPINDSNLPARLKTLGRSIAGTLGANCNNAVEYGFYYVQPGDANAPGGSYYGLLVLNVTSTTQVRQVAYDYQTDYVYMRRLTAGVGWQPWIQTYPLTDVALPARLGQSGTAAPGNDWNNAVMNGWYIGSGAANAPPSPNYNYWEVMVTAWDTTSHCAQLAFALFEPNNPVYYRNRVSGNWQAWKKVAPIDDENLPSRISGRSNTQVSDMNAAYDSGFYSSGINPANAPETGNYFHTLALNRGDGWEGQLAISFYGGRTYTRRNESGWQGWHRLFDSVEDERIGKLSIQPADNNSVQVNGWHYANGNSNMPPGDTQWYIQTMMWSGGGYCTQIAHALGSDLIYKRRQVAGSWQAWVKVHPAVIPLRLERDTTTYGISVSDWNNAVENGWYQGAPGTTNAPDGSWYIGQVVSHRSAIGGSAGYVTQRVWRFTDNSGIEWRRNCIGDSWSGWWRSDPGAASTSGPTYLSLVNGWGHLGSGNNYGTSTRTGQIAILDGMIYKPSSTTSPGEVMGWIQNSTHYPQNAVFGIGRIAGGTGEIIVNNNGSVVLNAWNGNPADGGGGGWVSLTGISYPGYP